MSAVTIERKTIAIEPEIYENIAAAKEGRTIDEVAHIVLSAAFAIAPNRPSLAEMEEAVQRDFDALGMTDEEFDDFVNEGVRQARELLNEKEQRHGGGAK